VTLLVGAALAATVVVIAVMAARDMDRRGRNGELYAVAVLFVLPLGLLMWGLDRRRRPPAPDLGDGEPIIDEPGPNGHRARSTGAMTSALVSALRAQQVGCAHLGSQFYAGLLDRVGADVEASGVCAEAMRGPWRGDLLDLAVPLRFLGALNRLVLDGTEPALAALWPPQATTVSPSIDAVLVRVVSDHQARITAEMGAVVQTNEVGRSAALAGGFLTIARRTGLPLRLLEVGTSAGLNLRWDQYHYSDRGTTWGDIASPLHLDGPYDGAPTPLTGTAVVSERHGCDVHPLDVTDASDRLWLRSFVWPDQPERLRRLDAAIAVAARVPVTMTAASASAWVPGVLADPAEGVATVVFHSIVWQYLPDDVRSALGSAMVDAGRRATEHAPLAWLRYEPTTVFTGHASLDLQMWPSGERRALAHAGFHGAPVTWL